MTTYRTNNPVGSPDPRDLYDNAENMDVLENSTTALSHPDRLGVSRKTRHGMEVEFGDSQSLRAEEFNNSEDERSERFSQFIIASGYTPIGDYAAGVEITEYNQIIREGDSWFRLSVNTDLPYTTTGDWQADQTHFIALNDATLRQELDSDNGGELVRVTSATGTQILTDALNSRLPIVTPYLNEDERLGLLDVAQKIQDAIDLASGISNDYGHAVVSLLPGRYLVRPLEYSPLKNWQRCLVVPDNVTLDGGGAATLVADNLTFENRGVVILQRGSNARTIGVNVEAIGPSTFCIGVGMGSAYDDFMEDGKDYVNCSTESCNFYNCWLSASYQMVTVDNVPNTTITSPSIDNCISYGKTVGSGGNFNFRSNPIHRVRDTKFSNCKAFDGSTASAFNHYGILGWSLYDCTSKRNQYAGLEVENGCQEGIFRGYHSEDDYWGVWIDDSSLIMGSEFYIKNSTNLRGIFISRQGFADQADYRVKGIRLSNFTLDECTFRMGTFGNNPAGYFESIQLSNFLITQKNRTINDLMFFFPCDMVQLSNGIIEGANAYAINGNTRTEGGQVRFDNIVGRANNGIGTGAMQLLNNATIVASACEFSSWSIPVSSSIEIGNTELGNSRPNNNKGVRRYYGIQGSPNGQIFGGPGSTAHRVDTGEMYVKVSGTGNTGWLPLVTG